MPGGPGGKPPGPPGKGPGPPKPPPGPCIMPAGGRESQVASAACAGSWRGRHELQPGRGDRWYRTGATMCSAMHTGFSCVACCHCTLASSKQCEFKLGATGNRTSAHPWAAARLARLVGASCPWAVRCAHRCALHTRGCAPPDPSVCWPPRTKGSSCAHWPTLRRRVAQA